MKKLFIFALFLIPGIIFFTGCNETNPVSTGFTSDAGYKINLGATSKTLPYGASMQITAIILDGNNNPIPFSAYPVTFTSTLGSNFAPVQGQIASGVVSTVYVSPKVTLAGSIRAQEAPGYPEIQPIDAFPSPTSVPSGLPKADTITVSYLGASAKLKIFLY